MLDHEKKILLMMEFSKLEAFSAALLLLCFVCGSRSPVCNAARTTPVTGVNAASLFELVSSELEVPRGNKVQKFLLAVGIQIYNYNGSSWIVANANATLYNFRGKAVGQHYFLNEVDSDGGQPTWESYRPVSQVTGKSIARVRQPDAADWVLLKATRADGDGKLFGATTYIQRLYTQHGLPPPTGFIATEGDVYESPYVAMYCFWRAGRAS